MKKASKLVALVLVLVMAMSLIACGGDKSAEKLYGTWSSEFDLSDEMSKQLGSDFADFDGQLKFKLYFDFNEDGTCKMYIDKDEFSTDMNAWIDSVLEYAVNMMYDQLAEQGIDKATADEVLEQQFGMPIDQYMGDMVRSSIDIDSMAAEMETTGVWEAKGNKLYMDEKEVQKNAYDIFKVEGDVLTIDLADGADASDVFGGIEGMDYPFTFNRVK